MEDKEFLEKTITISRDEFSDVIAREIAHLVIDLHTKCDDSELVNLIEQTFLLFSADIMTKLFDLDNMDELKIDGEE